MATLLCRRADKDTDPIRRMGMKKCSTRLLQGDGVQYEAYNETVMNRRPGSPRSIFLLLGEI